MQKLFFFVGKGGVGKTTVSAAYAIERALENPDRRVLLLSTDPAPSLSDILETKLTDRPKTIRLSHPGRLEVWQVDPRKQFAKFLDEYKGDILGLIDKGSIFSRADIEPLIDSALPGMAEISSLLAIHQALSSSKYAQIVVDTAPFGHTLRLFALPEQFLRFLNFLEIAADRDRILAAHFGGGRGNRVGSQLLTVWRPLIENMQRTMMHNAQLVLVTTAEKFSLNEAVRCRDVLASYSPPLEVSAVVLNRVVTSARKCGLCKKAIDAARRARRFLRKQFPGKPVSVAEDPGSPIMGPDNLASFAKHFLHGGRLNLDDRPPRTSGLRLQRTKWPVLDVPLSLVLGKGGVGKTTISAALAFNTRKQTRAAVDICSVDPAPSLDDIFQKDIGDRSEPVFGDRSFRASEMDSVALFRTWVSEIRSKIDEATTSQVSGIHVDLSFERQLLSELLEIVPPGVDELLAIFRILDLLGPGGHRVVVDMAPTGHALELLRMPGRILAWTRPLLKTLAAHRTLAIARDAGVKVAEVGQRVRELASVLEDHRRAQIHVVVLPEPLPDRETERLLKDLEELKLSPNIMFVNRVLLARGGVKCGRCRNAMQWQRATLARIKRQFPNVCIYVVRNFPNEIAGQAALEAFTGGLWRLA